MKIQLDPKNIRNSDDMRVLKHVREIMNDVKKSAAMLQPYDDVEGLDANPRKGSITMKDNDYTMSLKFNPETDEIKEFNTVNIEDPRRYAKFYREQEEDRDQEIYEVGSIEADDSSIREKVIVDRITGKITFVSQEI